MHYELGVTRAGHATRFALHAPNATQVELCLFDDGQQALESRRVPLDPGAEGIWQVEVEVEVGQLYGYRVDGPWDPGRGLFFNPHKLLVDPRARAIRGEVRWNEALRAARHDAPDERNVEDSAPWMPRCIVMDDHFDWGDERSPQVPWADTVIYECHVKGLTQLHPEVPESHRGRYLGLAQPAVIEHLKSLGVTTVELLPVHHHALDEHLASLGMQNYWGYATLAFFAPDARFASGGDGEQVHEFKQMVKALHAAGIEVVLDVVYNHTAEGPPLGPMYSLRGVDNASYYRLAPHDPAQYQDFSGTGNTLETRSGPGLELVLDSLRYWVEEMHVDGFRFDLAPALARDPELMDSRAAFFQRLQEDPLFANVKLIAEPWDMGPEGYQLGRFPAGWSEWNGYYRDEVRGFWNTGEARIGDLARCLSGSRRLFQSKRAGAHGGINFVTCHDGFTLNDLVSYDHKHNLENGEENRDGCSNDRSRNWGKEGPSNGRKILRAREKTRRNLAVTLAFSLGVPMISHGDELGRTQLGNNNAYCHDDERTWVDWSLDESQTAFLKFVRRAMALRRRYPAVRRSRFLSGTVDAQGKKDVSWLHPRGHELTQNDWDDPGLHSFAMLLSGRAADEARERDHTDPLPSVLLLMNGSSRLRAFRLPPAPPGAHWRESLHTACVERRTNFGRHLVLAAHSMVVLEFGRHDS
ncbi:MAG: isoamylase [Planctomycetota bacterium]|jgi:isoamylase